MATKLEPGMLLFDPGDPGVRKIWTVVSVGKCSAKLIAHLGGCVCEATLKSTVVPDGMKGPLRADVVARLTAENIALHNFELAQAASDDREDT